MRSICPPAPNEDCRARAATSYGTTGICASMASPKLSPAMIRSCTDRRDCLTRLLFTASVAHSATCQVLASAVRADRHDSRGQGDCLTMDDSPDERQIEDEIGYMHSVDRGLRGEIQTNEQRCRHQEDRQRPHVEEFAR